MEVPDTQGPRARRAAAIGRAGWLSPAVGIATVLAVVPGRADERPTDPRPSPTVAIAATDLGQRAGISVRRPVAGGGRTSDGSISGSWWPATAVVAVALIGLGAASLVAARWRLLSGRDPGPVQVVGRVQLTPRHAIHLLRAGDRTLIVGTGSGGPPALLGELAGTPGGPDPAPIAASRPIASPGGRGEAAC